MWVKRTEYNYDRYDYRTATMSLPLLDVLSFRTVEGDLRRLSEPETVIISESLAERMGVHAGDDVYLPDMDAKEDDPDAGRKPARRMTVAGVYADFAVPRVAAENDYVSAGNVRHFAAQKSLHGRGVPRNE